MKSTSTAPPISRLASTGIKRAPRHVFQVLTKRGDRMRRYMIDRYRGRRPPPHIWAGVSVEDAERAYRCAGCRSSRSWGRWTT